jgi:hypothetical protein
MPLFFFHVHHDGSEVRDPEGELRPNLDAAREEAVHVARDLAAELIGNGDWLDLRGRIEIADEDGKTLLSVVFRDALTIKGA